MTAPSDAIERMARGIATANGDNFSDAFTNKARWIAKRGQSGGRFRDAIEPFQSDYIDMAIAALKAIREPSEAQWGGLARQIIFWMDMSPKTPRALFAHLERSGHAIPQWLRDEPEMKALDHTVSKGTRAALVYRAMIDAALEGR